MWHEWRRSPSFPFGFGVDGPADAGAALGRVRAAGAEVIEHDQDPDSESFKCLNPDGHRIDVYWEP